MELYGTVDEDAADAGTWFADDDGDGFADPDVFVVSCTRPTGWLLAEDALYDYVGESLAGAGDVDGDGYGDVLVGAYRASASAAYAGTAFLLPGPLTDMDLGDATATLFGEDEGDEAGRRVAGLGDLEGDGYTDVAIAAAGHDEGDSEGAVYVIRGPVSGEVGLSTADTRIIGESPAGLLGVAGNADVDGDGLGDVLVGGPLTDAGAGAAWLFSSLSAGDVSCSTADARLAGVASGDAAGTSVALPGDVDKDGYSDLLVGAPFEATTDTDAGAVYLVLGPVAGDFDLGWADATFFGEAGGTWRVSPSRPRGTWTGTNGTT